MGVKVSVIIPFRDDNESITRAVESLDQQSLHLDEFEAVFVDLGSRDGSEGRLRRLAARRPNVRVVRCEQDESALKTGLAEARGELVLPLSPADRLFPQALQRLHDRSTHEAADVVIGRRGVRLGDALPAELISSDDPSLATFDPAQYVVAYRRERLMACHGAVEDLQATGQRSVVIDYACAHPAEPHDAVQDQPAGLEVSASSALWEEGVVALSTSVLLPPERPAPSTFNAILMVRSLETATEYLLPCRWEGTTSGRVELQAEIDYRRAALGDRLANGPWTVEVHTLIDGAVYAAPLPGVERSFAVAEGSLLALGGRRRGILTLEVGTTSGNVCATHASDATVRETVSGSLLSIQLPAVAVSDDRPVEGRLFVGRLALPSQIVPTQPAGAVLRGYVSGLAGSYPLSTQFGTSAPSATGLQLDVSGEGTMVVSKAVGPARRKKSARQNTPRRSPEVASSSSAPLAQRVRRGVPRRLEPAVRMLARRPAAARAYRRLTRQ